jgi:RHS repeat-associated protein
VNYEDREGNVLYQAPKILSHQDYTAFGLEWHRSPSLASDERYRYGFNGKEQDTEGEWGDLTHYDYGFRIYNPAIAKFLSVDPLSPEYPSWTPYAFAMNRPIDGIDLDGLEWKSNNKWTDLLSESDRLKVFGIKDVESSLSYVDLYRAKISSIQHKYYMEQYKVDCADFCFRQLSQFAYEFSLPVHIEDFKAPGDKDPTFNNEAYGYTNSAGSFVSFEEGDWKGFADAVGSYYGAADMNSRYSRFTVEASSLSNSNGDLNITGDLNSVRPGSILTYNWSNDKHGYHAQIVGGTNFDRENNSLRVNLINASSGTPLPRVKYRSYLMRLMEEQVSTYPYNAVEEFKVKEWDFKKFDENANEGQ